MVVQSLGIMSADSLDQISLRSLNPSATSVRSHIYSTDALDVEDDLVGRSSTTAESRNQNEPVPVVSSGDYIDGGYGWVVTAGAYSLIPLY